MPLPLADVMFLLLRLVLTTDDGRFMYIAASTLAIIFNRSRRKRVSLGKQRVEPLLGCLFAVVQLVEWPCQSRNAL